MAKKQSRKLKNTGKPAKPSVTSRPPEQPPGSATSVDREILLTIVLAGLLCVYLFFFLTVETAVGKRFVILLSLTNNSSIYWAFWTGSAGGTFHIFDRLPILIGVLLQTGIAVGAGKFLLHRTSARLERKLDHWLISFAAGLTLLTTWTFVIGCFSLFALRWLVVLPPLMVATAGWIQTFRNRNQASRSRVQTDAAISQSNNDGWHGWIWVAAIPFALFILWASMLPPWEYDVREYHLQVPKEWFQAGGIKFLTHNVYGNMPLGIELQALHAMCWLDFTGFGDAAWQGALVGKTIMGTLAVWNSLLLFAIGRRWVGMAGASCASLIYISTPWITANAIVGYNENAIALYFLAAILLLDQIRRQQRRPLAGQPQQLSVGLEASNPSRSNASASNRPWFFWLGVFVGSSVACKYTAVVFVLVPAATTAIWLMSQTERGRWKTMSVLLVLGVSVSAGPWLFKNLILIGNPVYPLLETIFGSDFTTQQVEQWNRAHSVTSDQISFSDLTTSLFSLVLGFKWISPILVPFGLLGFFQIRKRPELWWLTATLMFAFVCWWLLTHRLERFLLPVYPLACLVAGYGFVWTRHSVWLSLAALVLLFGSFSNAWLSTSRLVGDVRIFASMESLDPRRLEAKDYEHPDILPLSHRSPQIAWLNENADNSRVLFLGECRPLTAEFEVIYNTCFDDCETYRRFFGQSVNDIQQRLNEDGITHILVNWSELTRLFETYGYNVNRDENYDYRQIQQLDGKILDRVVDPRFAGSSDRVDLFRVR